MGWQKQTSRRQRKRASCRNPSLFAVEMRFYSCFMVVLPKKNGDGMGFIPSYYSLKLTKAHWPVLRDIAFRFCEGHVVFAGEAANDACFNVIANSQPI